MRAPRSRSPRRGADPEIVAIEIYELEYVNKPGLKLVGLFNSKGVSPYIFIKLVSGEAK